MGKTFNTNDLKKTITERIISNLENVGAWEKGWMSIIKKDKSFNIVTKKKYSLLNQLLLERSGAYATFKQWSDLGGKVKKGSKSEIVVFWKLMKKIEKDENGNEVEKTIPLLRYINVFHMSCVEFETVPKKLETYLTDGDATEVGLYSNEPLEEAEEIIKHYIERDGVSFTETLSNDAYYRSDIHAVVVPSKQQYKDINEYYSTVFHELTHSTSRHLGRVVNGYSANNKEDYSMEELVAELGSAFIMSHCNLEKQETINNSTAYIKSWIKVLKDNVNMIIKASGMAEKAVDYILGTELGVEL